MNNVTIPPYAPPGERTPDSRGEQAEFAALCKALGHPARVAILARLLEEGTCICGRIVEAMDLAQSTVSQHLKALKNAGLVLGEVEGPRTCYCVNLAGLARFRELAGSLTAPNQASPPSPPSEETTP